jgi:type II secretory pathway component GspD/PulD (secretin)
MIQVLLAEVTLDDSEEWGLDFNVGIDVSSSRIGGDGYVFNKLAAGAGAATALGVPNFSVASTDFELLVRALEVQGKLEVLSRPQVTVNNNETAFIQVGESVSVPTGANQFQDRVSIVTERESVGILMDVTPSISPDGFVRLEIEPSISSVSNRTTQIDENFEAPIITERRVQTVVTVQDGQTVVIGGLIQTVGEERIWKLPLFGDIPLVGDIFKSTQRSNVKTELLVVLRPIVIPGEGAGAIRSQDQIFNNAFEQLSDPISVEGALEQGGRFLDAMPLPQPPVEPKYPEPFIDPGEADAPRRESPSMTPARIERGAEDADR